MTVQKQLDGAADTSDEEGSDVSDGDIDGDDDEDLDKEDDDEAEGDGGPDDEPLNSDDDVSEEEQADLFDTDNVVVCQYDKVNGADLRHILSFPFCFYFCAHTF